MTRELAIHSATDFPKDARTGLTLPLSKSLGLQDLAKHQAMVAVELEVLAKKFDRFGWDRDRNSPAHDRLLMDWIEALQDFPINEVRDACKRAVLDNPGKMPNEGHVRAEIMKARREWLLANPPRKPEPEPERKPVSPERRAEIMAAAGYTPKRMDAAE